MGVRNKLVSQSSLIFTARMFGAGLIFLTQAAITRLWGPEVLAEYLIVIAAANIIGVVLPLGFETVGSYFAAEYRIKGQGRLLRGFMLRAYGHVVVLFGLLLVLGPVLAQWVGQQSDVLLANWWPLCVMTLGNALMMVSSALLIGFKRPYLAFFHDSLLRTVMIVGSLVTVWLAFLGGEAFNLFVWLVAAAYLISGGAQTVFCLIAARQVPLEAAAAPPGEAKRWWRFALPWIVIVVATDHFFDLDLMLLAGQLSKEDLAIFGVCARIFMLATFGLTAVYAVTLPDIFESGVMGGDGAFQKKVGDTNLVATVIALILAVGLAVGGPLALMLFGPEFQRGALPLAVLGLCLLVRAVMGPSALALSMQDRPHTALPAVAAGIATLLLANFLLVPGMGLTGAALAAVLSQSVWSIAMWLTALRVTRKDVSIFPRLREMLVSRREAAGKTRDA